MTKTVSFIIAFFFTITAFAQLPVGHMSINFKDASRSGGYAISGGITMPGAGRTIGTEVYYPATIAGNNQPVASGQFPIVVFGHGFAMTYDNYDNVYNRLASLGYIVLLPRTESGIFPTPVHADFGLDLKLLANQGMALNTISTPTALATFNGKVIQKSAVGGHSMGAGCSILAASGNNTVTCVFNFAAATSNNTPNSIASASLVTVPTLIVSGQKDNVADTTVQNSHYNATASTKKFHVIIKDVTHCDFGNGTSGTCTIGQAACGNTTCNMNLFRRYMTYVEPFLDHQLKGICLKGKQFMDTIQTSSSVRVGRKITGTLYTPFSVSIAGNTVVCSGNTTTLTASGASTYTWTSGVINGTAFTPSVSQNYTVSASDASGCVITNTAFVTVNATPTVSLNSGSICAGNSFTITPTGASTYTFLNGSSVVTPTTTTSYSVSGTSTAGCVSSLAVSSVTVNSKPIVTVNSGSICAGNSFTITPIGANTYTISGGTSVVSPTASSSYSVTGISTDGCVSSLVVSSVTVNAKPIVTVNSGSICAGNAFTISPIGANTYTISGGSSVVSPTTTSSYSVTGASLAGCVSSLAVSSVTVNAKPIVTVNSGSICSGNSFTISPVGANTYTVSGGSSVVSPTATASYSVTGTNTAGCVSSLAVSSVTVNAKPIVSVNSGSICEGNSFTITPTGASTYTFLNGSSVVTPTSTTSYSVSGTSAAGCVSSVTAISSVTVNVNPIITVNSGTVCVGSSFTITPLGVNTFTVSGGSSVVTPTATTSYSVSGTSAAGCVSSVSTNTVVVNELPVLVAATNNTLLCAGQSSSLSVTGADTYTWSTNENSSTILVSPTVSTIYSVQGTDNNGCLNSTTITQDVSTCTGINNVASETIFNLYPNPSNGQMFIEVSSEIEASLFDVLGHEVFTKNLGEGQHELSIENLSNGIYFLKVSQSNYSKIIRVIKN
jgi:dienelactone hydrolase